MCIALHFRSNKTLRFSHALVAATLWCSYAALLSVVAKAETSYKDRWVDDARVEWPAATTTIQMMGGKNAVAFQIGYLRSDWHTGGLIIICDGKLWSYDSLRIVRLSMGGNYYPFRLASKSVEQKVQFMSVLRSLVDGLENELPSLDESSQKIGAVRGSGGCLVVELAKDGQFRQFASNHTEPKATKQLKPAIDVLDWWFRNYVSLMVGNIKSVPIWQSKEAPLLPVEPHFPLKNNEKSAN